VRADPRLTRLRHAQATEIVTVAPLRT
jgi:hypothetical protein